MSTVIIIIMYLAFVWWLVALPIAVLVGKMIKRADVEDLGQATGVGAVYLEMDKHIEVLGHDTVLQWLPESIVDDYAEGGIVRPMDNGPAHW